ncbi:MAG: hypothetical protein KGJ62_04740 [Armatimonadetes bacterium]|nr:hypothetical protein [Armatimonadota bacterium]MDE2205592.1 hypothetical protein [Armatimonadota bacterium]
MNTCGLMTQLANTVRTAVLPFLGSATGRTVTGQASSGDTTFQIDEVAEEAIEGFMARQHLPWAVYTEDRGLRVPGGRSSYERVLIIDPIDGTRSAMAGLEACVVSIAAAPGLARPCFGDVDAAVVVELLTGDCIAASGGSVTRSRYDGHELPVLLREGAEPGRAGVAVDVVGAPLDVVFRVLNEVVSGCTLRGGLFVLNSTAFELTRLATGQLSAVVDVRARLLHELDWLQPRFNAYGDGRPIALCPYDAAAAAYIALQAGACVTDAHGLPIDRWDLLDTQPSNFGTLIAAAKPALHGAILESVERGCAELGSVPARPDGYHSGRTA